MSDGKRGWEESLSREMEEGKKGRGKERKEVGWFASYIRWQGHLQLGVAECL